MIWALLAILSLISAVLMGIPLIRRMQPVVTSQDATPAVLLDQLDEVKRDLDRGLISASEARAAEQELKRRILLEARKPVPSVGRAAGDGRLTLMVSVFFVPILALSYYAYMGSPGLSGIAFAERAEERQEAANIAELSTQLYERLTSDQQGGASDGWMLLGQIYSRMGRFADAAGAFEIVSERPEANSVVFSMLAEALIYADQGVVSPRAEAAIDKAFVLDAANPAATFYKAMALSQTSETEQAHNMLVTRLSDADGFYPWMESFVAEANRIGAEIGRLPLSMASFAPTVSSPGPTGEDIANAQEMTEEDRQTFIRSMVERLATRLEDEPEDLDGWMRLGNAYSVLGEKDLAVNALERAETLLVDAPKNDQRRQIVTSALADLRK